MRNLFKMVWSASTNLMDLIKIKWASKTNIKPLKRTNYVYLLVTLFVLFLWYIHFRQMLLVLTHANVPTQVFLIEKDLYNEAKDAIEQINPKLSKE